MQGKLVQLRAAAVEQLPLMLAVKMNNKANVETLLDRKSVV